MAMVNVDITAAIDQGVWFELTGLVQKSENVCHSFYFHQMKPAASSYNDTGIYVIINIIITIWL